MSLQDELRRLHSAKKPCANERAVGQQAGNESYMLIATGTTFGLLIEAADELDRLQAELAAAKLVDESSIVAELRKRVADQGNGCAEGLTTIPVIILSRAADYITHVQKKLRREEEKTEALTIKHSGEFK